MLETNQAKAGYHLGQLPSRVQYYYWKNKKLIRRWDSEHELSLRRHRTHTTKYNKLCINSATDRRGYVSEPGRVQNIFLHSMVGTQIYQIQWNNAVQRPLRVSRSFKVTDFGNNPMVPVSFGTDGRAMTSLTRNSSGDEIANVNFLYDGIVQALQNTIDSCMNSATDRRGYVSEHRFTKFSEITQCNGHYAVQGDSRSPILVPIESWCTTSY